MTLYCGSLKRGPNYPEISLCRTLLYRLLLRVRVTSAGWRLSTIVRSNSYIPTNIVSSIRV